MRRAHECARLGGQASCPSFSFWLARFGSDERFHLPTCGTPGVLDGRVNRRAY
jgi:hypothetical protein